MDFTLDPEQRLLREATRDILVDHCGPSAVRAALEGATDPKLWARGTDIGWTGLLVPEALGGSGMGLVELALVAEELGRALAGPAWIDSALVGGALSRASGFDELAASLADGSATASVVGPEGISAARNDGDLVLSGRAGLAVGADTAEHLLVLGTGEDGPVGAILEPGRGVDVRRQTTLDLTRALCAVELDDVVVPTARTLPPQVASWLVDAAAAMAAADALGAARRLADGTVEYLGVRVQFGRPIASFQAVKHACATMRVQLQGAAAAVAYAAMTLDAGAAEASQAASAAKAFTGAAADEIALEALQLHGGIGFTWEHDLHLLLRRIRLDALIAGDTASHEQRLGDLVLAGW